MKIECDGKIVGIASDEKKTVIKLEIYGANEVIHDLYEILSQQIAILLEKDDDEDQTTLEGFEGIVEINMPLLVDETGKPLRADDDEGEDPEQYGSLRPCCPEMRIKDGICQECEHDHFKHPLDWAVPNPPKTAQIFCDDCGALTEEIVARECEMPDGSTKLLCHHCFMEG